MFGAGQDLAALSNLLGECGDAADARGGGAGAGGGGAGGAKPFSPADMVAILEALREAGSLRAEIIVI